MKKFILPLVCFCALLSCEEENPQPVDQFAGSWYLSSPETPVEISFDVVHEGSVYNYYNKIVNYPGIPEDQRSNNTMITYDKFENGNGFGRIEIKSRGYFYYKVVLIYNRFTDDGLSVYDVQIDIPSEPL